MAMLSQRKEMIKHIKSPTVIQAQGTIPKNIEEFIGLANTSTPEVNIARMRSPAGWIEPGQTPEFTEYTGVLQGMLRVGTRNQTIDVKAGESVVIEKGEWVQYSSPTEEGAEYVSVCLPAFSPNTVHRDET
jgi:mannose-6-phosphate isomerase-like protein (cupin superfamily)